MEASPAKKSKFETGDDVEEMQDQHRQDRLLLDTIPHIFLPKRTPVTLTPEDTEVMEAFLLASVNKSITGACKESGFDELNKISSMLATWELLQPGGNAIEEASFVDLLTAFLQLGPGGRYTSTATIPLYVRKQNCTIIFEKNKAEDIIGLKTFRASLSSELVMTAVGPIFMKFPETDNIIQNTDLLSSRTFAKSLYQFSANEHCVSAPLMDYRGKKVVDPRDIADPSLINQWLVAILLPKAPGPDSDIDANPSVCLDKLFEVEKISFHKKVRDQVTLVSDKGSSGQLPFRRSGMWLSIKTVLQLEILKLLQADKESAKTVYKLVILRFVASVAKKYFEATADTSKFDLDLGAQILAKIGRRVQKLQKLYPVHHDEEASLLKLKVEYFKERTLIFVHEIAMTLRDYMQSLIFPVTGSKHELLPHPLPFLAHEISDLIHTVPYLDSFVDPCSIDNPSSGLDNSTENLRDSLELQRYNSFMSILCAANGLSKNPKQMSFNERIWLFDTEAFLKGPLLEEVPPKKILEVVRTYVEIGSNLYEANPVGQSQMMLAVLKAIEVLDGKAVEEYPLVKRYQPGVDPEHFQYLLLPQKDDMLLLEQLLMYFKKRKANANYNIGILSREISLNSFAVIYASGNEEMEQLRQSILNETEKRIGQKYTEVEQKRGKCRDLLREINSLSCQCEHRINKRGRLITVRKCRQCHLRSELESSRRSVYLFERPLPPQQDMELQQAVVFEILIPELLSSLRDSLAILNIELLENPELVGPMEQTVKLKWREYYNLTGYLPSTEATRKRANETDNVINLGSTCIHRLGTSAGRNSAPDVLNSSNEEFIVDNELKWVYLYTFDQSSRKRQSGRTPITSKCAFQIRSCSNPNPFLALQKYLEDFDHSQNEVICGRRECHTNLTYDEYLTFGSMRAGHRIQLRNLYSAINSKSLKFEEEPALALLLQTIWQVGPEGEGVREAHLDFQDDITASQFLTLLERHVQENEKNYGQPLHLLCAVAITVRIIELNENLWEQPYSLLKKWRSIIKSWTETVENELNRTDTERDPGYIHELKKTLLFTRITSAFSYNVSRSVKWNRIIKEEEDLVEWFRTISYLNNADQRSENEVSATESLSDFLKILFTMAKNVALKLELDLELESSPLISGAVRTFITEKWKGANNLEKTISVRFYCKGQRNLLLVSPNIRHQVTFDIILGTFLVNGYPEGFLPADVTEGKTFRSYFGKTNSQLQVQKQSDGVYRTKTKFHGRFYEFILIPQKMSRDRENFMNVVIKELWDDEKKTVLVMIETAVLRDYFPLPFTQHFTHWFDLKEKVLYFRRKPKQDADYDLPHEYKMHWDDYGKGWRLFDEKHCTYFLSIQSKVYQHVTRALSKMEQKDFINVMITTTEAGTDATEEAIVVAHLPRYNLRFSLMNGKDLECMEYPGFFLVFNDQGQLDTLAGLQSGVLLRSGFKSLLIVPHGIIRFHNDDNRHHHQTVISLDENSQPPYFVYEVDPVLKRLSATKSKLAWIYLAALHAITSLPLPDEFTELTGVEMAMRILQSGFVWKNSPYDEKCLKVLEFIKGLSPKRTYYGSNISSASGSSGGSQNQSQTSSMESIEWPKNSKEYQLPSMSAFDGFEIVIDKLIEDSERLKVLHVSEKKMGGIGLSNPTTPLLRLRSYYRHLNSYNSAVAVQPNYFNSAVTVHFPARETNLEIKCSSLLQLGSFSLVNVEKVAKARLKAQSRPELGGTAIPVQSWNKSLAQFLFSPSKDDSESPPAILIPHAFSVEELFTLDFHSSWMSFYSKLTVTQYRDPEDRHVLTIFLCALAYRTNVPLEQLLQLHYISQRPSEQFPLPPPTILGLTLSSLQRSDLTYPSESVMECRIREILAENKHIRYDDIQSENWEKLNRMKEEREDISHKKTAELASSISKKCYGDAQLGWGEFYSILSAFSNSHFSIDHSALDHINGYLRELEWKRNVKQFAEDVEAKLGSLYDSLPSRGLEENGLEKCPIPSKKSVLVGCLDQETNTLGSCLDLTQLKSELRVAATLLTTYTYFCFGAPLSTQRELPELLPTLAVYTEKAEALIQNLKDMVKGGSISGSIVELTSLLPRLDPMSVLKNVLSGGEELLTGNYGLVKNFAVAVAILYSYIKRIKRIFVYDKLKRYDELEKELENVGYGNWKPAEFPQWLLLQLELDIMIRPVQVDVAKQMMKMPNGGNGVMQLNMGEGKTSAIVPMLCSLVADQQTLCRVTVLNSIFNTNYDILSFAIGGLLNQRVYTVPCRRDMDIDTKCAEGIQASYNECRRLKGVVLTLPEYRLSFRLLAYDSMVGNNRNMELGFRLMKTENWLRTHAWDILDESDELLNVKYQLIYTVGEQFLPDGGMLRWTICQKLLEIVMKLAPNFYMEKGDKVIELEMEHEENPHHFPRIRLLDPDHFPDFVALVAEKTVAELFGNYKTKDKEKIKSMMTNLGLKEAELEKVFEVFENGDDMLTTLLIISGYLRRGVLTLGLTKRWRVEYGVNTKSHRKQMAVPFRAMDVPAERTEYGHPELAVLLTHLSYYYSGLTDTQLDETFKVLSGKKAARGIYEEWLSPIRDKFEAAKVSTDIRQLNLKNSLERSNLYRILRRHKVVIDFWLSHKVFAREFRQFPSKLVLTAWDLCHERQLLPTTGFSGTNDSRVLLPLSISQQDLAELQDTNQRVEGILLQEENQFIRHLPIGVGFKDILQRMKEDSLRVLIDAGALMLECSNEQLALEWLKVDRNIQAIVYFNGNNHLMVKSRRGESQREQDTVDTPFELSSFWGRLEQCGVFLDDQHTRGTDIKFPVGTRACVTVGGRMKRDKLIQACMRMRKLVKGHSVSFYVSHEAFYKIQKEITAPTGQHTTPTTQDLLEWTRVNTQKFNEDGLLYWAIAGKSYAQRLAAEDIFYYPYQCTNFPYWERSDLNSWAAVLTNQCMDPEVSKLQKMYGQHITARLLVEIIPMWFNSTLKNLEGKMNSELLSEVPQKIKANFRRIRDSVVERCTKLAPDKVQFTADLIDEEQEKELEKETELEEQRQVEWPRPPKPAINYLHGNVVDFVKGGGEIGVKDGIKRLADMFAKTTFSQDVQYPAWRRGGTEVFATNDFITVLKEDRVETDLYVRPIEFFVTSWVAPNLILVLSPFEVNEMLPWFRNRKVKCSLHMFSFRRSERQDLLMNERGLMLPHIPIPTLIPEESWFTSTLLLASGNLYFKSMKEQKSFARFLCLAPQPWDDKKKKAFDQQQLTTTGFVLPEFRNLVFELENEVKNHEGFLKDPSTLLRMILLCRHPDLGEVERAHVLRLLNEHKFVTIN